MTEGGWRRLEELYQAAADLAPAARENFLNRECAGNPALRSELESLLAANDRAGSFLADPPSLSILIDEEQTSAPAETGKRIGSYEVTGTIGEGGMGTVYTAARVDDQYRKQVAIKVIKRGMDTDSMLRRFRTERQILANLEHPYIARLLDGGATADGLPYYVMEYVAGEPINRYMDQRRLSIPQRIELFRSVCSAVQFAHRNLVVHRDLKPGNILVTGDGTPKLLDFGIAKLLEPGLPGETADLTATGMRIMTPAYASPEQVRGGAITTASDVYSLGVLLYELLAGHPPLRIDSRDPLEVARVVCSEEPVKPSTAVNRVQEEDDSRRIAASRGTTPDKLSRTLSSDLDTIVLKALAKDPLRRYSSAEHLSEDLRRYLDGLPVSARPDSVLYRAGKFVRRHRASVAAAALLLVAVAAGIGATLWQARIAGIERARAEHRFNEVRALANSFLFEFDDSIKNLEGATAARELIVRRALQYLNSLAGESGNNPGLQREIASAFEKVSDVQGNIHVANLGDQKGALESSRKALAIRESLTALQPGDISLTKELAASYQKTSELLWTMQRPDEALDMARKQIAAAEAVAKAGPSDAGSRKFLANAYAEYGWIQYAATGNAKSLVENERKSVALLKPMTEAGKNDPEASFLLGRAYGLLAGGLSDDEKSRGESLALYRKAVEISEALSSSDPKNAKYNKATAGSYNELGTLLQYTGDLPGALENQRRALAVLERMAAADPKNMQVRRDIGVVLGLVGELTMKVHSPAEGVPLLEKSLAAFESLPGPPSLQIRYGKAKSEFVLGETYARLGRTKAARTLYGRCIPELKDLQSRGLLQGSEAGLADRAMAALARLGTE